MITDIEKRLQALRTRQSESRAEGQSELDRWRSDLAEAKATMQQEMADAATNFERKIREAEEAVSPLLETHEALAQAITLEEGRIKRLRLWLWGVGLGVAVIAAAILTVVLWISHLTVQEAEDEATRIRTENAEAITAARAEGEAALATLTAELESREAALSANLTAMGAELAAIATERDTARADLERLAELRARIGFDLALHHDRAVIVLSEGQTLTPWNAPGFSDLARLNGQMWRVVSE